MDLRCSRLPNTCAQLKAMNSDGRVACSMQRVIRCRRGSRVGHAHGLAEELRDDRRAGLHLRQGGQSIGVHMGEAAQQRADEVESRKDIRFVPLGVLQGHRRLSIMEE